MVRDASSLMTEPPIGKMPSSCTLIAYDFFGDIVIFCVLPDVSHCLFLYTRSVSLPMSVSMSPSFQGTLLSNLFTSANCELFTLNDTQFQPFFRLKFCMKFSPPSKRTGWSVPSMASFSKVMAGVVVSTISRPVLYCHRRKFSSRPLAWLS